jgi:esterase
LSAPLPLVYREYGQPHDGQPPVLLLHGLLGSSANWHSIARRLAGDYRVLVPDLRNHGRSPQAAEMGYPVMATDLATLLERAGLTSAVCVGHSMGAKVAMWLALTQPEKVARLVAVDMAPTRNPNRFEAVLRALAAVDLATLGSREDADRRLARWLEEPRLRQYLLQNLALEQGRWRWRVNLSALERGIEPLLDFPPVPAGSQFLGPSLFIYGSESDYVTPEAYGTILHWFPYARLRPITGAGHWVYAEQLEPFLMALRPFLDTHSPPGH